ncbi:unnamed protein product [Rhodiola kirilowii]
MEEQHIAPYDMEWMKMAMLKHEDIFKQQVYELHRLYRIQKMLMKKIPKRPILKTDNPPRNRFNQDDEAIDLTLGLGTYNNSEKSSKKLSQTRLTSDSVMSFSSSSTAGSSSHLKKAGINDIVVYQRASNGAAASMAYASLGSEHMT